MSRLKYAFKVEIILPMFAHCHGLMALVTDIGQVVKDLCIFAWGVTLCKLSFYLE
jgi:hypothetical protein